MKSAATEHDEQAAVIAWASIHPQLRLLHAIPNGGSRSVKVSAKGQRYSPEARRFKAEGVKSGVPDLHLPVARHGFHGLWIEMKRPEGGKVSEPQRQWTQGLQEAGHAVFVFRNRNHAIEAICQYMNLPIPFWVERSGRDWMEEEIQRSRSQTTG